MASISSYQRERTVARVSQLRPWRSPRLRKVRARNQLLRVTPHDHCLQYLLTEVYPTADKEMTTKTNTALRNEFTRSDSSDPNFNAIFKFDADPSRHGMTQITLPERSTWTPGLHWHEQHIEYFKVLKGQVLIRLDGVSKLVTPEDGPQRVDRFVVHEFMRADRSKQDAEKDPGEVVTEEWTDPEDGVKHVFFRNIFSTLEDSERYWKSWTYLQALYVAAHSDDWVQVVPGRVSWAATHTLYAAVRGVGGLLGLQPWQEEYTPQDLRTVARGLQGLNMSRAD